ncbi:putative insulin receptor substrate [Daphnia sinensis]|uniref:Insulin receptor substrate 1 n=1 Tax=Daphnia sinensis TaxID=1820382 RepID=A0AAD5KTK6_9CRUS|nr:putative insulin receptor substrate [Daphnia sinensis]
MMLPHDVTDHAEAKRPDSTEPYRPGGILLFGYLRKLKRMKKKYFILTADSESSPARLEYFDSEKKWKNGQTAKRSIVIKSCFNINRKTDCKHKFVVALYTNEDCFPIAFDSEEELLKWFITLLKIHLVDRIDEGDELKPIYEHVWQVTVQRKELGSRKNIVGPYRLCLNTTSRILTLFKMPISLPLELWEFPVMTIRRCGHINCQFFMEMGRGTVTGAGELWMDLEDAAVAQNVHGAIIEAMRNSAKEDLGPRPRTRSSSANEQNRPSLQQSWNPTAASAAPVPTAVGLVRNRADSVPSRSRTTSESAVVTPTHDSRPSSVLYAQEGSSTSPPMAAKSIPSSYSMDDFEAPLHPVSNHIRSRLSHTATPENSLPKESTILEEDRSDGYLLMSHGEQAPSSSDYLSMTPRGNLSSSPSSVMGHTRALSLSNTSVRGGYKNRVTPVPSGAPPIKPPLHPQNPYMDMSSPVTTSTWASPPPSAPDGYLPMYPSGSAPGSIGTRSGTHTRSSSFCDEPAESYVPMAPQSVASSVTSRDEDGGSYMDMQCRRSVPRDPHHLRGRLSPASGSSLASSFTSGTPPVGRFQEYHLEKVSSFLTPSEDDDSLSSLSCRQSRAYSVGSRPDIRGRKMTPVTHDQPPPIAVTAAPPTGYTTTGYPTSTSQDARVRAYSVGSRVTPGNNKLSASSNGSSSSVSSSRHELEPSSNLVHPSPTHGHQQPPDESQRKKSLSVPHLGTSTPAGSVANIPYAGSNPTGTFFRTLLSQQQTAAVRRENDLMEIEFARALSGLNVSSDSFSGIDQVDCAAASSYTGQFGSSDSVGRSSVASTNSSTTGAGGRPRSASNQFRPSFGSNRSIVTGKPKLDSFRSREGRTRLERLESVPQGRDQDYIEYGESRQHLRGLESPDVSGPKTANKTEHDQDSADEYVELANPASRSSDVRLSVSESEQIGRVLSPGSDYMTMDGSKNKMAGSMSTVFCQIGQDSSASYIDMNFPNKRTPSQTGSVSDEFTYLPMDYTPRSSRNPSRQSSQADLILALGAVSPSIRGSQTPRSESARHSRTEESLQEQHYMEMTCDNPIGDASQSLLHADKSVRSRIPSPYDGSQTDSEVQCAVSAKGSGKKSAFLSNLFGRKSFSAGKSTTSPTAVTPAESGTLPRSSRSMPPSPFSSLKRPSKSTKSKRTTTAGSIAQSLSPVSPDVDLSAALLFHQRSQSLRSHSIGHSRSSLHSPLTPPSPSADFSMVHPQFSPPSPSVALTSKPGSSQPISISSQRQIYTPRGSPHTGLTALNLNRVPDADEYVLHHTRYSASPSRLMPMPTLSPLPEVLLNTVAQIPKTEKTGNRNSIAGKIHDGYMNMDFGANKVSSIQQPRFTFEELPGSGEVTPTMPSTPRAETSLPVRIPSKANDDKENSVVSQQANFLVDPETPISSSGNGTSTSATPTNSIPAKQRANSLEKIVGALEKAIIGPKRHSSGDKPMKRSSGTLIHRSNSYQPSSASRVVIAGSKPASLFPLLMDIPAGKVMSISSKDSQNGKNTKSLAGQNSTGSANRMSTSSLISLGEDLVAGELQAVNWNTSSSTFIPLTVGPSPTTLPSNSPSPSLPSRPTSVQSERAIHYAQLDLTPTAGLRSTPKDDFVDEIPKSPRIPRPTSVSAGFGADVTTTYAQIDFKKSEGIKTSNLS